jgi:lysophospholipase L1-like esterase
MPNLGSSIFMIYGMSNLSETPSASLSLTSLAPLLRIAVAFSLAALLTFYDDIFPSVPHPNSSMAEPFQIIFTTTSTTTKSRSKIILLGDSITQQAHSASLSGWGTHLADVYQRRADVYNRGFSGYNTDWILQLLETNEGKQDIFGLASATVNANANANANANDLDSSGVPLITIFFGANDASDAKLNPRHHVPVDRFMLNLKQIIQLCRQHFGAHVHIILITPPPVHHTLRLQYQITRYGKNHATGELERTLELSGVYAKAVIQVATELQLVHLNLWNEMQESRSDWDIYLSDGLHLSREGNMFVGKRLEQVIQENFQDVAVTPCPHTGFFGNSASKGGEGLLVVGQQQGGGGGGIGPWHDEINHLSSEEAFKTGTSNEEL